MRLRTAIDASISSTRPRRPAGTPNRAFRAAHVTLGAASGDLTGAQTVIDGFWFGLAKRSIQVA
jgi:hypothetical protein